MADLSIDVEPEKFVLLEAVAQAAGALGIRWLLAGAGGRVLLLERLKGLPPGRATEDLDFGVMVRSWDEYGALKDRICEGDHFHEDLRQSQRLWYGDSAKLDLVPFGAIAEPDEAIRWSYADGVTMNVLGFQEACDTAIPVMLNGHLEVPVATAQGMLLLKFIAWQDRHERLPGKDASDIAYILYYGEKIIGEAAFYEEYSSATEAVAWDLELASTRILGLQMASLGLDRTKRHLITILNRELAQGEESTLVREVAAGFPAGGRDPRKALILLQQVQTGLMGEGTP